MTSCKTETCQIEPRTDVDHRCRRRENLRGPAKASMSASFRHFTIRHFAATSASLQYCALKSYTSRCLRDPFEIKSNRCAHFRISSQGFCRSQQQLKICAFEGLFVIRVQIKRHNFGSGNHFGQFGDYPKDVPFVCQFWRVTVWAP